MKRKESYHKGQLFFEIEKKNFSSSLSWSALEKDLFLVLQKITTVSVREREPKKYFQWWLVQGCKTWLAFGMNIDRIPTKIIWNSSSSKSMAQIFEEQNM